MSSNEDNDSAANKRKGHRPCDMCRRKKRRCKFVTLDGSWKQEVSILNGQLHLPAASDGALSFDAFVGIITWLFDVATHNGPIQQVFRSIVHPNAFIETIKSHVESLENRLKTVEAMLRESSTITSGSSDSSPAQSSPTGCSNFVGPGIQLITSAIRGLNSPVPAPHPDDLTFAKVLQSLNSLSLDNPGDHGFQGKSSQAMLVKAAVELRSSHTRPSARNRMPPPAKPWTTKPWARPPPRCNFNFPPLSLMLSLIALFRPRQFPLPVACLSPVQSKFRGLYASPGALKSCEPLLYRTLVFLFDYNPIEGLPSCSLVNFRMSGTLNRFCPSVLARTRAIRAECHSACFTVLFHGLEALKYDDYAEFATLPLCDSSPTSRLICTTPWSVFSYPYMCRSLCLLLVLEMDATTPYTNILAARSTLCGNAGRCLYRGLAARRSMDEDFWQPFFAKRISDRPDACKD
ncbi:hypothetical protein C8R43DRAFT_1106610 [Mycena crocata]|nr:hypothetical protein C8R43DRAFT_1106610 [Mycena crocata]